MSSFKVISKKETQPNGRIITKHFIKDLLVCTTEVYGDYFCTIGPGGAPSNIRSKYKKAYRTTWDAANIETLVGRRPKTYKSDADFQNGYPDLTWGDQGYIATAKVVKEKMIAFINKEN